MDEKRVFSTEVLKQFEPLSTLSDERLSELAGLAMSETHNIGTSLFSEGDIDSQRVYLLNGDVQLKSSDGVINMIVSASSPQAKFPLDDSQPRQVSCVAMSLVDVIRIDNSVLDYMMTWDQLAVSENTPLPEKEEVTTEAAQPEQKQSEVKPAANKAAQSEPIQTKAKPATNDAATDGDRSWIRKMRHIMAFKSMPSANIKQLLEHMESVDVKKGDLILKQGDPGNYYYVLTEGQARITRTIELAKLEAGTSFGEEALIAESKRNATVTMTTDGNISRLAKSDFESLLKEPLMDRINADEARVQAAKDSVWLDVRHAKEFYFSRLPKAINIPLHEIRLRQGELDKNTHYICYCSTGKRSSAAAFLLRQNGYNASVLNGGVQTMAKDLVK